MSLSFVLLGVLILAVSCGGKQNATAPAELDAMQQTSAPSLIELEDLLTAELERLGVDPAKCTAAAPSAGNAVFDLQAVLHGSGGDPEALASVELTWTERLIGDYNQDGLVNVSDLTPLGAYFLYYVAYEESTDRDGIEWWPLGDPDDDGNPSQSLAGENQAEPPVPGSPSANWRLARIDGDYNGIINAADITPIAQHWGEQLHGYHIYRAAPGSTDFTQLADPDHPSDPLFIPRTAAGSIDPHRPVRYEYTDLLNASGEYRYYVVPVCRTETELVGPASRTAQASNNLPPQAVITATAAVPGGPLYTFDASESTDSDGSIVRYQWDLDGDTVYETDSGNIPVLEHCYDTAGEHGVRLRVTDDAGASGATYQYITVESVSIAYFTCSAETGRAPFSIDFDPAGSYVTTGISIYRWDFEGDGSWDVTTAYPNVQRYTYEGGGYYFPCLQIRDEYDQFWTYDCEIFVESGAEGTLYSIPPSGPAPLDVRLVLEVSNLEEPYEFEWDLDADGIYELNTGEVPTALTTFTEPGEYRVRAQVRDVNDEVGFFQLIIPVDPELQPPAAIARYAWLGSTYSTYPETAFRLYSEDSYDPDGEIVLYTWEIDDIYNPETIEYDQGDYVDYVFDNHDAHVIALTVTDDDGLTDETTIVVAYPDPDAYQANIAITADKFLGSPGLEVTFQISAALSGDREVVSLELDMDDGTVIDLGTDLEQEYTYTFGEGDHNVTASLYYANGEDLPTYAVSDSVRVNVTEAGYDVAVIRDDGGVYDANYNALIEDLDTIWNFTEFDWYSGIPADLSLEDWGVVVWYRGGPGSDSEPQVYTTEWADAEIDDYIQLMKNGHSVLLMSQSHGRNIGVDFDTDVYGDGWELWYGAQYGWQMLSGSIADDDIRHPWAASLGTDKAFGGTGTYGYLEAAPRNILPTTAYGTRPATDGYDTTSGYAAERFNGTGSSGDIPMKIVFPANRQFVGIGYYDSFMKWHPYANAGLKFYEGLILDPPFEDLYDLAFVSYGNMAAPDENIGYLPDYSHTEGPGVLWVIGYPWAELDITQSSNGYMTRPMLLMNIMAWLRFHG